MTAAVAAAPRNLADRFMPYSVYQFPHRFNTAYRCTFLLVNYLTTPEQVKLGRRASFSRHYRHEARNERNSTPASGGGKAKSGAGFEFSKLSSESLRTGHLLPSIASPIHKMDISKVVGTGSKTRRRPSVQAICVRRSRNGTGSGHAAWTSLDPGGRSVRRSCSASAETSSMWTR